jgi:hypothetical protein
MTTFKKGEKSPVNPFLMLQTAFVAVQEHTADFFRHDFWKNGLNLHAKLHFDHSCTPQLSTQSKNLTPPN